MPAKRIIYIGFWILLGISFLVRLLIAGSIELGNDEVYYWTYARFPALSHFDHPPMVGLVIQLFTFNLTFDSELFLRLAAVVFGTLSTGMMFLIGKFIKNELTGFYAALLFTASLYGFVLSGTFILPDSPQVFFWLVTLLLLLRSLPDTTLSPASRRRLLLAGLFAGLAILSKYHAVFLLTGAFFYILLYNRRWLKNKTLYLALLVVILCSLPIFLWNLQNSFISFTFHENRVGITESGLQPKYFLTEMAGEFLYNNPVNVIIILLAMAALFRKKNFLAKDYTRLLLWISLPLMMVFWSFSLFRPTLPHWTGPGYLGFMLIAAAWCSEPGKAAKPLRLVPAPIAAALAITLLVVVVGVGQIMYGWIPLSRLKVDDITHDLTGWKQLGDKFSEIARADESEKVMEKEAPLLTFRWFPAANLDYYAGRKTGHPVYALGELERIHKYYWINQIRGNLKAGSDAWYLALSDDFQDPAALYGGMFDTILPPDTLTITRGRDTVRVVGVYRLKGLKADLRFPAANSQKPF